MRTAHPHRILTAVSLLLTDTLLPAMTDDLVTELVCLLGRAERLS